MGIEARPPGCKSSFRLIHVERVLTSVRPHRLPVSIGVIIRLNRHRTARRKRVNIERAARAASGNSGVKASLLEL